MSRGLAFPIGIALATLLVYGYFVWKRNRLGFQKSTRPQMGPVAQTVRNLEQLIGDYEKACFRRELSDYRRILGTPDPIDAAEAPRRIWTPAEALPGADISEYRLISDLLAKLLGIHLGVRNVLPGEALSGLQDLIEARARVKAIKSIESEAGISPDCQEAIEKAEARLANLESVLRESFER